jgi:hypothetical protein
VARRHLSALLPLLDAEFPCEESRRAEHRVTDERVDRAIDDQDEQGVDIVIDRAGIIRPGFH